MATVYLAHDVRHDRKVAVKVLRPDLAAVIGAERFLNEIRVTAKLQHPHILPLHDSGKADSFLYYVMPYVQGESLRTKLKREKQLSIEETVAIATAVASALDYAHRNDVIHRDIKPENILINEGQPVVADFGIALAVSAGGGTRMTETGLSLGTPHYMSPEQATADRELTGRSDLYSLACVTYEMLAGEPPYTGATMQAVIAKIMTAPIPDVRTVRDNVPERVARAVERALAKVPGDRFNSAAAFADAVNRPKRISGRISAGVQQIVTERPRLALSGTVLFLAGVIVASAVWRLGPSRQPVIPGSESRLQLLVSATAETFDPALSLDGTLVVYAAEENGQVDLFLRRVAGGQMIRLTDDPARELSPMFSPDGEHIAFTREDSENNVSAIWTVETFGGQANPVIAGAHSPTWSPDGTQLGFVRTSAGQPDVLATAAANGSNIRELFRNDAPYLRLRNPSWSPDDSHLAVVRSMGGVSGEIWLVTQEGDAARLTTDPPDINSQDPVHTPDGSGIVHSSNRGGAVNLWVIPVGGGKPRRLTTGSGPDESPSVAGTGTIAYLNSRWRSELFVYDLQTRARRTLATHARPLWAPVFSPDDRTVAVSRTEADGAWHIWLVDVADGSERQLTFGSPPQIYAQFMPSGTELLYHSWTSGPNQLFRVPVGGGPPVALTPPGEDAAYADVSPDGTQLVYVRSEGAERLYVVPVGGGEARLLTSSPGSVPRWSPNGQWITFSADRSYSGGVFVIAPDGTGERRVTERGGWPMWWPDGSRIGYRVVGPDGTQEIYVVPFEGGASERLLDITFSSDNAPFDISSDGTLLTTTNGVHLADEIWLLDPER